LSSRDGGAAICFVRPSGRLRFNPWPEAGTLGVGGSIDVFFVFLLQRTAPIGTRPADRGGDFRLPPDPLLLERVIWRETVRWGSSQNYLQAQALPMGAGSRTEAAGPGWVRIRCATTGLPEWTATTSIVWPALLCEVGSTTSASSRGPDRRESLVAAFRSGGFHADMGGLSVGHDVGGMACPNFYGRSCASDRRRAYPHIQSLLAGSFGAVRPLGRWGPRDRSSTATGA